MPKPLLTKRREAWAAQRADAPVFKGSQLHPPAAVSARYVDRLSRLTAQMTAQVMREVERLFKGGAAEAYFAQDASIASGARILMNRLTATFEDLFARHARDMAQQMVDGAAKASGSALHSSLQTLSGGLSLKTNVMNSTLSNVYKATVAENVSLIKSIPGQYLKDVEGSVMRSITNGNGLQDLVPALQKYEGQTHRRARNIALDQTRKAYGNINKGRMQSIGVKKFQWHHSGGGAHPREDHEAMDGEIYSFDDLPVIDERTGERGIPGQAINCRCTMSPVFDFSEDAEGE